MMQKETSSIDRSQNSKKTFWPVNFLASKLSHSPSIELSRYRARRGFTIVEMLVAMGLFITVVTIVTDVFIQSLRSSRTTVALINANANASVALEQMSRELRTGSGFSSPGSSEISFANSFGSPVTYRLNAAARAIERSINGEPFVPITASDVGVLSLAFTLLGNSPSDGYPPRITVILRVTPANIAAFNVPIINFQTTVSARELDG